MKTFIERGVVFALIAGILPIALRYSSGYYSYIWSEVLDADAFQAFKETSLFDHETAQRFREEILSQGGTRPGMELYEAFRGRAPRIEPLLERRGLDGGPRN